MMGHKEWRQCQHGINSPQAFGRYRLGLTERNRLRENSTLFIVLPSPLSMHCSSTPHGQPASTGSMAASTHKGIHFRNANVLCPAPLRARAAPCQAAVLQLPWGGGHCQPLHTARASRHCQPPALLPAALGRACALSSTHRLLRALGTGNSSASSKLRAPTGEESSASPFLGLSRQECNQCLTEHGQGCFSPGPPHWRAGPQQEQQLW